MPPQAGHARTLSALPRRLAAGVVHPSRSGRRRVHVIKIPCGKPVNEDSRSGMVTGWPGSPWAESPAGAPIRNRLTARPARPISRHRPPTRTLSAPAQPESVTLAFPDGAQRTVPCPVTGPDVAAISHGLARAAFAIRTSGGATRRRPRRAPCIHRRKGSMDADAGRATTRTCRGHPEGEAVRHPACMGIDPPTRKAGTMRGLHAKEGITIHRQGTVGRPCRRIVAYRFRPE